MKDQNVEILLQTPLLTLLSREEIRDKPILEQVSKIVGKIISENAGGVTLSVKAVGSYKTVDKNPHFSQIFIPYHKIDHILFV